MRDAISLLKEKLDKEMPRQSIWKKKTDYSSATTRWLTPTTIN
jgi:hypothetical protein